tara:strand:- start:44018 stop:44182 length:165 start_codon:yes stop_codon:yes gene_type:complete
MSQDGNPLSPDSIFQHGFCFELLTLPLEGELESAPFEYKWLPGKPSHYHPKLPA